MPDSSPPPAPSPATTSAKCPMCNGEGCNGCNWTGEADPDGPSRCKWCGGRIMRYDAGPGCAKCGTVPAVAPPASDAPAPPRNLRSIITRQQVKALLRVCDNEANPGDVALVHGMALAIAASPAQEATPPRGSAPLAELLALNLAHHARVNPTGGVGAPPTPEVTPDDSLAKGPLSDKLVVAVTVHFVDGSTQRIDR